MPETRWNVIEDLWLDFLSYLLAASAFCLLLVADALGVGEIDRGITRQDTDL